MAEKWNIALEQTFIEEYKNGKSMRQMERDYGVSRAIISKFLEKVGVKTTKGNHYRKYVHQYDYFNEIDSEEKAYWLGFMFADGYICNHENRYGEDSFGITLHAKDVDTLEKFKRSISSTNPITDVSKENTPKDVYSSLLKKLLMI